MEEAIEGCGYETEDSTGELNPEAVEHGGSVGFRKGGHGLKVSPCGLFHKVILYRDFITRMDGGACSFRGLDEGCRRWKYIPEGSITSGFDRDQLKIH